MLSIITRVFSSNRSQRGLWHGTDIRFGNQYSFSHRASWKPNVQVKRFWSDILERPIQVSVTVKALRTIRKKGSLDNYLLSFSSLELRSKLADQLKSLMLQKLQDPSMRLPYIPRTYGRNLTQAARRQKQCGLLRLPEPFWLPQELRGKNIEDVRFQPEDILGVGKIYIPKDSEETETTSEELEAAKKRAEEEEKHMEGEAEVERANMISEDRKKRHKPSREELKKQQRAGSKTEEAEAEVQKEMKKKTK